MEFRRIDALPPYAFAEIDALKVALRQAGHDVVDLAFGNPDLGSPAIAVSKLIEAVQIPKNHRYSMSRGIPKLRGALADLYERQFDVTLDPETEICATIGAKEGFSHLMLTLVGPGDTALVPSPSYPIHIWGPVIAGATVHHVPVGADHDFIAGLDAAYEQAQPRPRVLICSFPHNPTTVCVDYNFMVELVAWAQEHDVFIVHDFAYADLGFDGYVPPSILQVPGAKDVAVEIYSMTKSFSMAGWRVGFVVGNKKAVAALARIKSYLDYGSFQPIQIAATATMNEAPEYPHYANVVYQNRRDTLIDGLARIGWEIERPHGTMFVWAPLPAGYEHMTSFDFARMCVEDAHVAVSPGSGFGPGGEGYVRFALVENEQRIRQGIRHLKRALSNLQA